MIVELELPQSKILITFNLLNTRAYTMYVYNMTETGNRMTYRGPGDNHWENSYFA